MLDHKWLFALRPRLRACDARCLQRAFAMTPDYLADVWHALMRSNSRPWSGLSRGVWIEAVVDFQDLRRGWKAIEHGLRLAERAAALIAQDPAWEVVTAAQLGIVTFARSNARPGSMRSWQPRWRTTASPRDEHPGAGSRSVACVRSIRATVEDVAATLRISGCGQRRTPEGSPGPRGDRPPGGCGLGSFSSRHATGAESDARGWSGSPVAGRRLRDVRMQRRRCRSNAGAAVKEPRWRPS